MRFQEIIRSGKNTENVESYKIKFEIAYRQKSKEKTKYDVL